ncbi:MAG: cupredoxin domain-containing protein [Acidobacteriota bacterium]
MRKFLIPASIFAFLTVAVFSACSKPTTTDNRETASETEVTSVDSHPTFHVDFASNPEQAQAGQPTTLSFTVKDQQGSTVKDLQIVHEKQMHLLIVSKDLAEFYHVHPEQSADGSYKVDQTFPHGGDYKLYADFTPQGAVQVVEQIDVKVAGPERAKVALVPDPKFEKVVDGLKIVMRPSADIKAGQELTLDFQAFDAATGRPATGLENYLGELAHFVIISEDLKDFVHAHPMAKGESMDAMNMGDAKPDEHGKDGHEHGAIERNAATENRSEVSAHTTFPRAGLYKLWAQFQRAGKVINVPFIVNVPGGNTEPVKAANVPAGFTKIVVSENGFEPSTVNVRKGGKVSLAFYRADADNCGGEVVIPTQSIRKTLPVGETVLVEFTPAAAGDLAFACGMDMLKGKIVVSEN